MQKAAFAIILSTVISSTYAISYRNGMQALSEGENADGSFTIHKPVMYRGTKSYSFSAYTTSRNGLCRSLGFSKEHSGYTTLSSTSVKERATLNSDGNFNGLVTYRDESIESITCLKGNQNKFILKIGSVSENRDGSVTISDLKLLRGTKSYNFSAYITSRNGLCRSMGFRKELSGYTTISSTSVKERATLNSDGNFDGLVTYRDESIESITCLNSESVLVIEDRNGNLYISKERVGRVAPVTPVRPIQVNGSSSMQSDAQALAKTTIAKVRSLINEIGGNYANDFLTPIKDLARTLNTRSMNGANRRTILNSLFHLHSLVEKAMIESTVADYELRQIKSEVKNLIDSI